MALSERETNIYALIDNNEVRYVGKTQKAIEARLRAHIRTAEKTKTRSTKNVNWMKSLLALGRAPSVKLLATVPGNGSTAEIFYIRWYRMRGAKLNNLSTGGDGGCSIFTAAKIWTTRKANGTNLQTKESLARMIETKRRNGTLGGWKKTKESVAKTWETRRKNGTTGGWKISKEAIVRRTATRLANKFKAEAS